MTSCLVVFVSIIMVESSRYHHDIQYQYDFSNQNLLDLKRFDESDIDSSNVTSLNLESNRLKFDKLINRFKQFEGLEYLNLKENEITHMYQYVSYHEPYCMLCNQRKLKFLDLSRNYLTALNERPFRFFVRLEFVDLSHNKICKIDRKVFSKTKKLRELDLSRNLLKSILNHYFCDIPELITLNLNGNNISKLDDNSFNGMMKLENLLLLGNKLKHFSSSSIGSASNTTIKIIDLRDNVLSTFPVQMNKVMANNSFLLLPMSLMKGNISYVRANLWSKDICVHFAVRSDPVTDGNNDNQQRCRFDSCNHYKRLLIDYYMHLEYIEQCPTCAC
ncbi:Uncharacterised protein g11086 [Pycnogonum litorale]